MSYPQQFLLDIEHPHDQTLDNFVVGDNAELVDALGYTGQKFTGLWIFGQPDSGRSHLLRGACLAAQQLARQSLFIRASALVDRPDSLSELLARAVEDSQLVAIDDAGLLVGERVWEELLVALYQRLLTEQGVLLLTDTMPAPNREFALPDLASRLSSLQHFQIRPLNDEDKADLLRRRAGARGYELSEAVLQYWLTRGPRDIAALLSDLDVLDKTSLTQQRLVTIPLLKQALGY